MNEPIDLDAIRQRAREARSWSDLPDSLDDIARLCDEITRLRGLVKRSYMDGFCAGNKHPFLPTTAGVVNMASQYWDVSPKRKEMG